MTDRRATFDSDAALYRRARPGYPPDLVAALLAALPGRRVLEIGPGTGQLTAPLVAADLDVTAVELGPRLAVELAHAVPAARVEVGAFETWPLPPEPFDAVIAATSWHWLDPAVRGARVAAALRPGGVLVTVTTIHLAGGTPGFFEDSQACYLRFDPDTPPGLRQPAHIEPTSDEIDASPLFAHATRTTFTQDIGYTTDAYLDVLRTYSNHIALPDGARAGLLTCLSRLIDEKYGGRIVKRYGYLMRAAAAAR